MTRLNLGKCLLYTLVVGYLYASTSYIQKLLYTRLHYFSTRISHFRSGLPDILSHIYGVSYPYTTVAQLVQI